MTQEFDVAVLIGRFQPFHNGHAGLLAQALATAPQVLVLLGSGGQARSAKNPFTWRERADMIAASLSAFDRDRVRFLPIRDYYDDLRWVCAVHSAVAAHCQAGQRIALIGYVKDASSYYLQRFPDWAFVVMPRQGDIDATRVRQLYFDPQGGEDAFAVLGELLPPSVATYLHNWVQTPHFANLKNEYHVLQANKKNWGIGPFITLDAVVTAGSHVLLIQRKNAPGQDLWALPGGFLDGRERLLQGAIRELREETGLSVSTTELEAALQSVVVFDHPDRSQRGRTITHAHYFALLTDVLPDVQAADDAALARWVPISQLVTLESQLFEDHLIILDRFLAILA